MNDGVRGNIFIVAAPSGGGKTSLVKALVESLDGIEVSVSHTTRSPRPGERDGVDYFFVSDATFTDMINHNEFIEHAKVFNHYYGTSVKQIETRLEEGIDVALDIDWQGALQIRHLFPEAIGIFIVPPSLEELRKRLKSRAQDNEEVIALRMQQAQDEMSHFPEFDFLLINDDFSEALFSLKAIVVANRLTLSRQTVKKGKLLSLLLTSQ